MKVWVMCMCELCKDTGWIHFEKDGKDYAKRCDCQKVIESENRLKRSGISEEFMKKTFDNYNDMSKIPLHIAKSKAMQYTEHFPEIKNERHNSIIFMGQVGSGKTHLSMAICNKLLNEYKTPVLYMPYRETILRIKQSVSDEINYNNAIERYKKTPVLMIDDLLKGKNTEADTNILFEIINYRYLNNLPMIVSTEKTLNQLLDFDEGVMSRLIEMANGYTVEIKGQEYNYRLNGGRL